MTDLPSSWESPDRRPIPDPTKLTNDAIERVTLEYRREIGQLQELIEQRIAALDHRLDERYATQVKSLDSAFAAAEKAVSKAETAADARFAGVNEFRQTLADQARTFLTVDVYDTAHKALEDKILANSQLIGTLTSRFDLTAGDLAGIASRRKEEQATGVLSQATINNRLILLGVGISVIVIVVNIVIAVIIHH